MTERRNIILLIAAMTAYAVAACATIIWAVEAHTPCASDFEGGCGYAITITGLLAWIASCVATGAAGAVACMSAIFPKVKLQLVAAGIVLGLPALSYAAYGIYSSLAWMIKNNLL
jgi:hypothetical protein